MTDWHSHILPGVDDGFKSLEDSLAVLDIGSEGFAQNRRDGPCDLQNKEGRGKHQPSLL